MRVSNKNLIIIALICFALGTLTRIINNMPPSNPYALSKAEEAQIGKPAPVFTFTTIDGRAHQLRDFEGKAVVINFWATWCPPCVVEFPQMLNLARETHGDAIYIFLSSDTQVAPIERFVDNLKRTQPKEIALDNVFIAQDPGKTITQTLYQSYRLPETYLLSPDLSVADKIIGASVVWDAPEIIEKVRGIAKKQNETID